MTAGVFECNIVACGHWRTLKDLFKFGREVIAILKANIERDVSDSLNQRKETREKNRERKQKKRPLNNGRFKIGES